MPNLEDLHSLKRGRPVAANDLIPIAFLPDVNRPPAIVGTPAALVAQGFTHAYVVNFNCSELRANTTADLDESITLLAIPANSVVNKARLVVTTPFTGLTALNIFAGRTADTDGYIASVSGLARTVVDNTGAEIDTVNEVDVITASDQSLVIVFDPGANAQAVGSLTAGQAVLLVSLTEIADYANLVPAVR